MFKELAEEEVFQVIQENLPALRQAMELHGFVAINRTSGNHRLDVNIEIHTEYEGDPIVLTTRSNDYGWALMDLVKKALDHFGIYSESDPDAVGSLRLD